MYAPLYGNRLIHNSNLKALEKKIGKTVDAHLAEICEIKEDFQIFPYSKFWLLETWIFNFRKDKDALENWRGFYRRSLSALDKDAEIVILFGGDCFYDEETRLVTEVPSFNMNCFQNELLLEIHRTSGSL